MQWLILGVGLLVGMILLVQGFATADPKKLARLLRWLLIGLAAAAFVALTVTGRIGTLLFLAPLLIPLVLRWRAGWNRAKAMSGGSPGQVSNVETAWLRMWLDHDSGNMGGEVLAGPYQGQSLATLTEAELLDLLAMLGQADPQSASLVEAFLDRAHPDWRGVDAGADTGAGEGSGAGPRGPADQAGGGHTSGSARGSGSGGNMTEAEALQVLGLEPDAGTEEVKEAHRRLMLRNHPDQGGSTYIAAKLNQAKDILLRHRRAKS